MTGWEGDIVLSTRARLARNLRGHSFPGRASADSLKAVARAVLSAAKSPFKGVATLRPIDIDRLDHEQRAALVGSRLVSVVLATGGPSRYALVDERRMVSVMVNEEDHLRIQAILPGQALQSAWRMADQVDDQFAERLAYAVDARYGFLTASLANCGTALRISVMAHMKGLAMARLLQPALSAARTLGVSVRGLFGEDTGNAGDVYQVSNAVSMGLTEAQIVSRVSAVVTFLLTEEQSARQRLWASRPDAIRAAVAEAFEKLRTATRLADTEAMEILSALRLGDACGIETGVDGSVFKELLVTLRLGAHFVAGKKGQYTFYEETRRPALIRNRIRARLRSNKDGKGRGT
jgi:protein arginine kinase